MGGLGKSTLALAAAPAACQRDCGCGGRVTGGRVFLPGHDQRAVHERIARQWGDTLGFIAWFDNEYGTDR
jgi:translation initiation factor 1 (eIF-1/SUI1)